MSQQSMTSFMSTLPGNEALAGGLYAAVGNLEGSAAEKAVADFASANGFDVAPSDVATIRADCLAVFKGERDLSDDELETVGGGLAVEITAALIGGAAVLTAAGVTGLGAVTAAGIGGGAAIVSSIIGADGSVLGNWVKQW